MECELIYCNTNLIYYINNSDLIPGNNYYIEDSETSDNYWYLKFKRHSGSRNQYNWFTCLDEPKCTLKFNQTYKYYIKISHEEYKKKIREKYDATCLNIVLKRVVNENFQW